MSFESLKRRARHIRAAWLPRLVARARLARGGFWPRRALDLIGRAVLGAFKATNRRRIKEEASMSEPKTVCAGTVDVVPNIFIPAVDSQLTIDLPGERTRATVKRVVDQDRVIVELTTMPMSKSHQYRFKDTVAVRRTVPADMRAPGSVETWAVVEERRTLPHDIPAPTPAPDSSRPPVAHGFR